MIAEWTHHLKDPDEKERFRKYVRNNRTILERLTQISKKWEEELEDRELDKDSYDSPAWAYKQADNNGYRRCLRKLQTLLTLDQKDNNVPL